MTKRSKLSASGQEQVFTTTPSPQRSENMRRVRTRNTSAEMTVRRLLHRRGFRFSLHRKNLPGTPDIVLRKYRTVIFVNGCFWHGHDCRRGARPSSNALFWQTKIERNASRDRASLAALATLGWKAIVVWECELRASEALEDRLLLALALDETNHR
jgi:DNA mismatch endonuclease (patch repair protein)